MKHKKQVLALLLAAVLLTGIMPATALAAGSDTGKAIQLADDGTAANITGKQTSSIYFGTYQQSAAESSKFNIDPIKWSVLSNADGKLFLLSDQILDMLPYHNINNGVASWDTCTLRAWLNGHDSDDFLNIAFSDREQVAIADTELVNEKNPYWGMNDGKKTTDKIFLLSLAEASNKNYFPDVNRDSDLRPIDWGRSSVIIPGKTWTGASLITTNTSYAASLIPNKATGNSYNAYMDARMYDTPSWWLRTSGMYGGRDAMYVNKKGTASADGKYSIYENGVRPAFNLDLSSVLFTSAAEGGKASSAADGSLTKVGKAGSDWKLTLLDSSRSFSVTSGSSISAAPGGTAEIVYSGAKTGSNEYVSAMLADGRGNVLYYGHIASNSASGTASVTIPADLAAGSYTLKVFSEQCNGDKKTDFASAMVDIALTADPAFAAELQTEETPAEDAPTEEALAEDAPTEEAPAEDAPAEDAPAEEAPVEDAPAEDEPADSAPAEDTPAEEVPAEDAPAEEASAEGASLTASAIGGGSLTVIIVITAAAVIAATAIIIVKKKKTGQ